MRPLLDEVFELVGEKVEDYLHFQDLDPMYELHFGEKKVPMTSNHIKMRETIAKLFPGEET